MVKAELERAGTIGWYRNPPRASQDSLGVIYEEGGNPKIVRPDFVFFARLPDGTIAADIVDPHGTHFGDAIPKLKGLAQYAADHGSNFRRIEVVAKVGDSFKVLDLKEESVRSAVEEATSISSLYGSSFAAEYTT